MLENPPKMYAILELTSGCLNLMLYTRIWLHKKKIQQSQSCSNKTSTMKEIEKQAITTITNNSLGVLFFGAQVIITVVLNGKNPKELSTFPHYILAHYRVLVAPIFGLALIFLTCLRSRTYVKTVKDEIQIVCRECLDSFLRQ